MRQWDLNGSNKHLPELDHSKDKYDSSHINDTPALDPDEVNITHCLKISQALTSASLNFGEGIGSLNLFQ